MQIESSKVIEGLIEKAKGYLQRKFIVMVLLLRVRKFSLTLLKARTGIEAMISGRKGDNMI